MTKTRSTVFLITQKMKSGIFILLLFFIILSSCESANDYHTDAETLINDKKYAEALNSINKAIQLEPDSVNHYILRMMLFGSTGRHQEEILDLNRIIELNAKRNSKSLNAHRQRAFAQMQLGLNNEALLDINYFIENSDTVGSLADAYLLKGSILYKINDYKASETFYQLALKENTDKEKYIESEALVGLANLTNSPEDAIKLLDKAISIDDNSGLAYGARMEKYMDLSKIDEAYSDSKKAMQLIPDDATVNFNIGQLFANYLNNNDSARIYFKRAIKLSPESPNNSTIYMNLAIINHRSDKLEAALADFQKAEGINPKDSLMLYNFALLLSDLNRNKEALEKISNAINNSSGAEYFNLRGSILLSLFSFDEAEKEFKRALQINPKYGAAFYNLGYLFGEQNSHEQSIKYYDKAILFNYDLKATLVNRALQKIRINKTSSACSDLKKAYELGRDDIKPLIKKNCE